MKERGAGEAWAGAQDALTRCRDIIEDPRGDPRKAQAASVVYGVLVDKAAILERAAAEAAERQARITRAQAELLAAVVEAAFRDVLGRPAGPAVRKVVRHHLGGAERGRVVEGAPDAGAATPASPPSRLLKLSPVTS